MRSETGVGYVAILLLLAVLSTLGLSFIHKVGMQQSAVMNQKPSMQADYLAESAANHALWRLLNEPGFPASGTVYYMHSLANGRYGYKVRKPTPTTFATVATVGAVDNMVTKQSYVQYLRPHNILTGYSRQAGPIPKHRRLVGASWSDAADTVTIGPDSAQWIVLKGCPRRKEIIMGTLDGAEDINLAVWDGTTWGNLTEFTQTAIWWARCFDIAYESQSGDGLVVGRYDATTSIRYNIWDGGGWALPTPQEAFVLLGSGSRLQFLEMESHPQNDEILIATVNDEQDVQLIQWSGSNFNDLGKIEDLTATMLYGAVEVVYEQQSGDALILWNHSGSRSIYYTIWIV